MPVKWEVVDDDPDVLDACLYTELKASRINTSE